MSKVGIVVEYRWAEGRNDRLSSFATDLLLREVAAKPL